MRLGDRTNVVTRTGNQSTGRVEIYLDGRWGTVQYSEDIIDVVPSGQRGVSKAICRQLGFGATVTYGTVALLK